MDYSFLFSFLRDSGQIIGLAIDGLGLVLSLMYRKTNVRKYTMTLIAFAAFLISSLTHMLVYALLLQRVFGHLETMVQLSQNMEALNCLLTPIWMAGWVLLFIALFKPESDSAQVL